MCVAWQKVERRLWRRNCDAFAGIPSPNYEAKIKIKGTV
jgi:hypothetical protein